MNNANYTTQNTISNVLNLNTDNIPSLSSSAMLVELSISSWTGRKKDKAASKKVTDENGADAAVASVNKTLLSDCEQLINIKKFIGEARNHAHYRLTLPWSDTGLRLLPTEMFFDYQGEMTHYEALMMAEVDSLIDDFEYQKQKASARLGTLFNEDDYPTAESLRDKFSFRVNYMPLPDAGDFRLDIGNEAMQEIKDKYEDMYTSKIEEAMQDIWYRVHKALSAMSSRLGYNDNGKPLIFRDSLVDNALDMLDILKKCNVTKDSQMQIMADKLEDTLRGVTPEGLREDSAYRDDTKKSIDELIKTLPSLDL